MAKLRFPTSSIDKIYNMYSGNYFPDIDRNYIFLIKDSGTYDLSIKEGFSGARLIIRNDSASTISLKLSYLITVTINSNKLIEVIWDNYSWFKISVDIESPLLLGETETTAYRGDRGKAAYDHISLTTAHEATASNTASRIVLRDGSGNFSAGTITASLFVGQLGNRITWNSTTAAVNSVVGQLSWTYYGNSHTIIDISAGTTPNGVAHDRNNAENAWTSQYPTLVGWNGTATYGIRVDSARVADTVAWSGVSSKPNLWSGDTTNGYWGLINPAGSASDWIRTTTNGIIPYASGGSGSLGTSSWPFNYIYGTNIYGTIHGSLDSGWCVPAILIVPTNSNATNGCMWIE